MKLVLAALLVLAQIQLGFAQIVNTVTVTGSQNGVPVTGSATASVGVETAAPSMTVSKAGILNDDDGTPGLSAGDTISYTVTIVNTGNVSLSGISVADPSAPMTFQTGDDDSDNQIDPSEIWSYSGSYSLLQSDLDNNGGGDGDIDNTVTVSSDQLPDQSASTEVTINPAADITLEKTLDSISNPFPNRYDIEFLIQANNSGQVTLSPLQITDDLSSVLASGTLISPPTVSLSGFTGTGGVNGSYDGTTTTDLLSGDVQLAPGQTGEVRISVSIDTAGLSINATNTAIANSPQLLGPINSDDPGVTPSDPTDTNPTPVLIEDTDSDGSIDVNESTALDRDGDGVVNSQDYDPTGYLYCEGDGRILTGGSISVENLTIGGVQSGVGSSNGIVIVQDGSSGQYQFYVTQDGTYRLSVVPPAGVLPSITRLPLPTIDVTTLLPGNPGIMGAGEVGSTGLLADFSALFNPFHFEFDIELDDPVLFNNNIPMRLCGSPAITADIQILSGPILQSDGRSQINYSLTATSSGTEPVNEVRIADDLASVFGAGNFSVSSATLNSAPAGFGAAINPFFDGQADTGLLTSGGNLDPGESVTILLSVLISAPSGTYVNEMAASGLSPIDSSTVGPDLASISTDITTVSGPADLIASKTASQSTVLRGQSIGYTLVIENTQTVGRGNLEIVDQMPAGFTYIAGSARVDGTAIEPSIGSRELVWSGLSVPANGSLTITMALAAGAAATGPEFVNRVFARDEISGNIISNVGQAKVRLEIEPVFDCSDIIGRVFEDLNRDGYYQDGEPGLPGVRLATVRGLLITTDSVGRYHITCPMIPDAEIGSNFIVKLDDRTLPAGFTVTTENPRVVRLTQGRISKINFGAAPSSTFELTLDDRSFEPGTATLKRVSLEVIDQMLADLQGNDSRLKITYLDRSDGQLARERIDLVGLLVRRVWELRGNGGGLEVETQIRKPDK
ncbi:MAG: DUF7507 domain-containing protein [Rhizobiaceae bacterium]